SDNVWAVGDTGTATLRSNPMSEHWNGSSWTPVSTPTTGSTLWSVSAVSSSAVWAVGTRDTFFRGKSATRTLAEMWDGTGWHVTPTPNPQPLDSSLASVSALSAQDVVATGADRPRNAESKSLVMVH